MLQKSSSWKTAEIFFINPTESHYLRDISRKINLAHTSVKNSLIKLIKLGIITESIEKKASRSYPVYKANINSDNYKICKRTYNLTKLTESNVIKYLEDRFAPRCIVLFGSYFRGEDIEDSDIDLFLECKEETANLRKFEIQLSKRIQLHFNKDFKTYSKELKNNIINGIVVSGYLEGY